MHPQHQHSVWDDTMPHRVGNELSHCLAHEILPQYNSPLYDCMKASPTVEGTLQLTQKDKYVISHKHRQLSSSTLRLYSPTSLQKVEIQQQMSIQTWKEFESKFVWESNFGKECFLQLLDVTTQLNLVTSTAQDTIVWEVVTDEQVRYYPHIYLHHICHITVEYEKNLNSKLHAWVHLGA